MFRSHPLELIAVLVMCAALVVGLSACPGATKDASHTLYNAQLALNTAVQASDNALDAACTDLKADKCGKMLIAHQQVLELAKTATTSLQAGRTAAAQGNDSAAVQAAQVINQIIQQINAAVQAANQGAMLEDLTPKQAMLVYQILQRLDRGWTEPFGG